MVGVEGIAAKASSSKIFDYIISGIHRDEPSAVLRITLNNILYSANTT